MSDTLPGLVVLAIGGSIAPPLLLLTILFLGTRQPLPNAGALALGYFTTCAVIGISGLLLFGGAESTVYTVGRVISATVGALLIVMGLYAAVPQRASTMLGTLQACRGGSTARSRSYSAWRSEHSSSSEATWWLESMCNRGSAAMEALTRGIGGR